MQCETISEVAHDVVLGDVSQVCVKRRGRGLTPYVQRPMTSAAAP